MFACLECGHKFRSIAAAKKAAFGDSGCPKCGGSDIDLAPAAPRGLRAVSFALNDLSNDPSAPARRLPKGS